MTSSLLLHLNSKFLIISFITQILIFLLFEAFKILSSSFSLSYLCLLSQVFKIIKFNTSIFSKVVNLVLQFSHSLLLLILFPSSDILESITFVSGFQQFGQNII
ncbi:MAG: hypothetical protein LBQ24_00535 [Candidatus Peribacteria bacterium]|nr:hypothetical protein [Candidatus Peribacteria bacterium]